MLYTANSEIIVPNFAVRVDEGQYIRPARRLARLAGPKAPSLNLLDAAMLQKLQLYLFPTNRLVSFWFILAASLTISFLLIGSQIFFANWSLIDNWDYFNWLGPSFQLPLSDIWNTLITKTEVGSLSGGRFRPTYYFLMILETSLWGPNVHLWYLARTLVFGLFIASIWWILSRFTGLLLGAILLMPILGLSFWGDIWARLGPSEIYGTGSIGIILFGIYGVVAAESLRLRTFSAAITAIATLVLMGAKETFIPVAALSVVILFAAAVLKLIPKLLAGFLITIIFAFGLLIVFVVQRIVTISGTDFYGDSVALPLLIKLARDSFIHAVAVWGPLHLIVMHRSPPS